MLPEVLPEVLDIACGSGRHTLFFARNGCRVVAMERSVDALTSLHDSIDSERLPVSVVQSDVENMSLLPESFDAIVNTCFLFRPLAQRYEEALRPGGILYFRTFTTDHQDVLGNTRPRRDFLLEPDELRRMFRNLEVLHYGESVESDRALATLVAVRRLVVDGERAGSNPEILSIAHGSRARTRCVALCRTCRREQREYLVGSG